MAVFYSTSEHLSARFVMIFSGILQVHCDLTNKHYCACVTESVLNEKRSIHSCEHNKKGSVQGKTDERIAQISVVRSVGMIGRVLRWLVWQWRLMCLHGLWWWFPLLCVLLCKCLISNSISVLE